MKYLIGFCLIINFDDYELFLNKKNFRA